MQIHVHIVHVQSATDILQQKLANSVVGSCRIFEPDTILISEFWISMHTSVHCTTECLEMNIMLQISKGSKSPLPFKTGCV